MMTVNTLLRPAALPLLLLASGLSAPAWSADGDAPDTQSAIFGGGCFWCVEQAYDKVDGVVATISGYSGGGDRIPPATSRSPPATPAISRW